MKHKVRVDVVTEKRGFLGIKHQVTEKKTISVDGRTYRMMKREEREKQRKAGPFDDEALACAAIVLEEECDW